MRYIVDAANLLEKEGDALFEFHIVGDGPLKSEIVQRAKDFNLKSVKFYNRVSPEELTSMMALADICLGQFGDTQQVNLVVPTKIYDACAMSKPTITARGDVVASIFSDKKILFFVTLQILSLLLMLCVC